MNLFELFYDLGFTIIAATFFVIGCFMLASFKRRKK
jgi:uncharacterized membrane protein